MGLRRVFPPPLLQKIDYLIKSKMSREKAEKIQIFCRNPFDTGRSMQDTRRIGELLIGKW